MAHRSFCVRCAAYSRGVRYDDIQVGKSYALVRNEIKATVLSLEPNHMVRVRFDQGVKRGETRLLRPRAFDRLWGTAPAPRYNKPSRALLEAWAAMAAEEAEDDAGLDVGETVKVKNAKTPLDWIVVAIDHDAERVTIKTTIFEREQTLVVAPWRLERSQPAQAARTFDWRIAPVSTTPEPLSEEELKESLRPVRPQRELDEIMDNVMFSNQCLAAYQRRYARRAKRDSALLDRLRDEIRVRGFLVKDNPGEFARVRVPNRFDVVLAERPTAERPLQIENLVFAWSRQQRRGGRRRGSRRSTRAA